MSRAAGVAIGAVISLVLSACATHVPHIVEQPLRAAAPLDADLATQGAWPAADWWKRYQDPALDELVATALRSGPTLGTASARFASARQAVRVTGAAVGVQVDANASFQRQRLSDNGLFPPEFLGFNWYNQSDLGVSASYTFDWWGRKRATVAAAVDEAHAAQAERSAAALALAGAVAETYFSWQAYRARLAIAQERITLLERRAHLVDLRLRAQLESADMARSAAAELSASRETVAVIEGALRLRVVALAALLGQGTTQLVIEPRPLPTLDVALPGNLGLDLIARRPDIAASRWRVEAARRNLVAQRAEYFPDVSLHALAGLSSIELGKLLRAGSAVPSFGAALHLPLFDSGLRDARFGERSAQVDAAIADYDETVVDAAREVAGAAATAVQLAAQRAEHQRQLVEAEALRTSAAARLRAGTTSALPDIAAQLALLAERDATTQLHAAALNADVALQRALGGGYDVRVETP